ncbi:hypothetical protein ACTG2T_20735 [Aeromonas sp. 75A]|uniref:hypothetical protein n=1 Tax=unclassified Aeromonas TaxID=257493 RepID=UPI002E7C32F8|nr:hypothetical protein [Aeromonas sp. 43P]MEE1952307.1 hypothetical protein [Aeromonas sp. 43P]
MSELIGKLSTYNIFNFLLPGIVFSVLSNYFVGISLVQNDILVGAFFYYFIGLIISRIGSVIVEPLLLFCRVVKFEKYERYIKASKLDTTLPMHSETNNMFRTFVSLFMCLGFLKIYKSSVLSEFISTENISYCLLIGGGVLFVFAYRKQTQYITKKINKQLDGERDE